MLKTSADWLLRSGCSPQASGAGVHSGLSFPLPPGASVGAGGPCGPFRQGRGEEPRPSARLARPPALRAPSQGPREHGGGGRGRAALRSPLQGSRCTQQGQHTRETMLTAHRRPGHQRRGALPPASPGGSRRGTWGGAQPGLEQLTGGHTVCGAPSPTPDCAPHSPGRAASLRPPPGRRPAWVRCHGDRS